MDFAAQRHQCAVAERNRLGYDVKALADPIYIADQEGVGFVEVALYGKSYNYRSRMPTNAQCEIPRPGVSLNFNGCIDLVVRVPPPQTYLIRYH